ncbi:hypothetical protein O53_4154 [Microcystis aeruginosa TAIHU98]|uniref:Uncharacterized protein n=1 Tax=Microcystis aeruginosa TAIHU98 TaxID=1134457 RepID=L7E9G1_MICAE|nr:hypothetical protein O53_4154 [Microcystis aeruginosa TAIHU98]ODV40104.1 hypothetical protein BFG60_0395 [Microcystis aeruginosa NIES-98]
MPRANLSPGTRFDQLESKHGKKIIYFREPLLTSPVLNL